MSRKYKIFHEQDMREEREKKPPDKEKEEKRIKLFPDKKRTYSRRDKFKDYVMYLHQTIGNQAVAEMFEKGDLQAMLYLTQPKDDYYEIEADEIAEKVVKIKTGSSARDKAYQTISEVLRSQRIRIAKKRKALMSPKEKYIRKMTGGVPLTDAERAYYEERFNHDFRDVRIHTDAKAAELADTINAKAFTFGKDIVFGKGQYQPATTEGKKLIAHELTHTIQQNGGKDEVVMRKEAVKPETEERTEDYKLDYSSFEELKKKFDEIYKFLKNRYKNVDNKPNTLLYMTGTFEYENAGLTFFTEKGWNFLMNDVDLKGNFDKSIMTDLKEMGESEDMKEMRGYLKGFIDNHPGRTSYSWNYKDLKKTFGKAKFDDMLENDTETLISLMEEKMPDNYKKTFNSFSL